MQFSRVPRFLLLMFLALTLHVSAVSAQAAGELNFPTPKYRLTLLGEFRYGHFSPENLNDLGAVVGTVVTTTGNHAAVWRNGTLVEINVEGGPESRGIGINNRGDVAGVHLDEFGEPNAGSFFWRRGQTVDIGTPFEGAVVTAMELNDRGQMLVNGYGTSGHYYLWNRGTFTELDPVPGALDSQPQRLNYFGEVAGFAFLERGDSNVFYSNAVLWRDGTSEVLELPPGMLGSSGRGLNDRGDVVGDMFGEVGTQTAFLWRDGETTALPLLDGKAGATAQAINNWGQVVGWAVDAGFTGRTAVLWQNGRALNLNELVGPEDPLKPYVTLQLARFINERGQIVVSGVDSRKPLAPFHYLLTPVY